MIHRSRRGVADNTRPSFRTKILAVGVVTALGSILLAGGALGPGIGDLSDIELGNGLHAAIVPASLSYSGKDVVLTGSVDHMFQGAFFTGPNRSEKQDRYKPRVDAVAFAQGFEQVRQHMAEARKPVVSSEQSLSRVAAASEAKGEVSPRISVASINPALGSSALTAIDSVAASAAGAPVMASEQLAYARADQPATVIPEEYMGGTAVKVSDREMWCLATAIYFEARGESYNGQIAVAQVVMNRVKHRLYPKTICGVVFQNQQKRNSCQFSFACDGIAETINDPKSWRQAEEIAKKFVDGELYLAEVADSTHYHATYVSPKWAPRMSKVTKIGLHVFYKFRKGWTHG